jgi:hypothetical protein
LRGPKRIFFLEGMRKRGEHGIGMLVEKRCQLVEKGVSDQGGMLGIPFWTSLSTSMTHALAGRGA